jgi:hypothetical protein
MDSTAAVILSTLMRWMHIGSITLLVGGAAYARWIVRPALDGLDRDDRKVLIGRFQAGFRPLVYAATVGIAGSGLFNFFSRAGDHTPFYHALFGTKVLLALHVFASAVLMVRRGADEQKYFRLASGVLISGLLIILISAYLRRIF